MTMERKIEEIFEYKDKKLKVVEKGSSKCKKCFFHVRECLSSKDVRGFCLKEYRTDKKSVIFVEVKDEQSQEQPEQPQKLNLCEILKYCPQEETLWSPLLGGVKFHDINQKRNFIVISLENGETWDINADGTITFGDVTSPEIMLYPSREQRDWAKFTAPWYKKEESIKPKFKVGDRIRHKETNKNDVYEISKVYDDSYGIVGFNWGIYMKYQDQYELVSNKFDPKTLKPFDEVVVSNIQNNTWHIEYFSHIEERCKPYPFFCLGDNFAYCIPYNDDTKHLVGTKEEAPEFYRYWED